MRKLPVATFQPLNVFRQGSTMSALWLLFINILVASFCDGKPVKLVLDWNRIHYSSNESIQQLIFKRISYTTIKQWINYPFKTMSQVIKVNVKPVQANTLVKVSNFRRIIWGLFYAISINKKACIKKDRQTSIMMQQHSYYHLKQTYPCGYLVINDISITNVSWTFTAQKSFMLNITVHKLFVTYTERCIDSHAKVTEISSSNKTILIATYCGHSLSESLFTKYNKAMLYVHSKEGVILDMMYHIAALGSAYRFNGSHTKPPFNWTIRFQDNAVYLYYLHGYLDYVWYYTFPVFPHYIQTVTDTDKNNITCSATETDIDHIKDLLIVIDTFACLYNQSSFHTHRGVMPIQWLIRNGSSHYCNYKRPIIIPVHADHVYASFLLHADVLELNLTFTASITFLNKTGKNTTKSVFELKWQYSYNDRYYGRSYNLGIYSTQRNLNFVSSYSLNKIYYNSDWLPGCFHLNLQFDNFLYKGYTWNVHEDVIHYIYPTSFKQLYFPKGSSILLYIKYVHKQALADDTMIDSYF